MRASRRAARWNWICVRPSPTARSSCTISRSSISEATQIAGCEALLRWNHPVRGMISPAEFIPIAEETGLICQIGDWVLDAACAEAAHWPAHIKLAVNVSPVQFRSHAFALKVANALATSGLAASRLELEITEAVLIRDDEAALAMLQQLRAIGVRIALDDFGTGYSSLSYLQRFPFDKIKIDRCFVNDIAEAEGSSRIVQAVINIARARNMTTTAEGVETEQQRELLLAPRLHRNAGLSVQPAAAGRGNQADADGAPRGPRGGADQSDAQTQACCADGVRFTSDAVYCRHWRVLQFNFPAADQMRVRIPAARFRPGRAITFRPKVRGCRECRVLTHGPVCKMHVAKRTRAYRYSRSCRHS